MASSIRWLRAICSGRSAIPWAGSKFLKMWSMSLCAFCLFSGVNKIISPIILVCDFRPHHICTRTPDEIGNSTDKAWRTFTGTLRGPLLLSAQGATGGLAEAVPHRLYRSPEEAFASSGSWRTLSVCLCADLYCWYEIIKEHNHIGCTLIVVEWGSLF